MCKDYFIRYAGSFDWWRWPQNGEMTVYNYLGGHHDIDENSERWMNAAVLRDVKDWHDLYEKVGYCFMHSNHATSDMWININGHCFTCEDGGHEIAAEYICDILYGVNEDDWDWYAGDYLIEHRWIKVTTNEIMLEEYILCGMYDNLYTAQKEALKEWAKDFGLEEEFNHYGIF